MGIRLWGERYDATRPVPADHGPSFDPEGKYFYFLGKHDLNPVYDQGNRM
jgi:tricorn protease